MKLYNSLTRTAELLEKSVLNIYSCGPTVYNYIHIGNARPSILMDVLIRFLETQNIEINFLQNITDIDDKIINKAIEQNQSEEIVSKQFTEAYLNDLKSLNVKLPNKITPISEKMPEMIAFIQALIDQGDAYVSGGNVYFNINKQKANYGQLSGRKIEELISGERVEIDLNKKNPLDFTLWKNTDIGKKWNSPFGEGRPGWHTECAVLIEDYFKGKTIDIHAGGIDLKFPHHENERIQYIAKNKIELANLWMHNGHLTMSGEKMSKSLGNVILVKEFVSQYNPNLLRWIFLTTNYKQPLNISDDLIEQALKFFEKLNNLRKKVIKEIALNNFNLKKINSKDSLYVQDFFKFMNDDLNTPKVLSLIEALIKNINNKVDANDVVDLLFILNTLGFGNVFNLDISKEEIAQIKKWKDLLDANDFVEADKLRDKLKTKGLI
ncbi:cysteinyl-tRNA synthetase [Williamsoniiplasma somnilux]|uniref:Cysteine--tRNA ligase n=1 Tax=Williamsoniiplasma somnilux TaxID=215578 RepID=A0A2K8NZV3_9MOLU|nr:cysteine--tRNA ligase [Williamsoniiplasma somnilux]ATZ19076.1 cysteinyl-tRNA synthetase [Williamsoniiplasma somnilux]